MANIFKLKTKPSLTTSLAAYYTVPANTTAVVLGISLANITSGSVTADVLVVSDTADVETNANTYLGKNTLEIMQGNKLVLQATDVIQAKASATSSVDLLISVMEIT